MNSSPGAIGDTRIEGLKSVKSAVARSRRIGGVGKFGKGSVSSGVDLVTSSKFNITSSFGNSSSVVSHTVGR
ncbi:hypothetical protein TNCV_1335521 [Trichonephila clavipes]|nr:hypothetical protein TNCV_1335521 [Trichonephila clavipes]